MKKEFPIEEEWLSFQLRPQTPPQGIPYDVLFPGADMNERMADFNRAGIPFGIKFGQRTFLSSSRLALQAAEYARDHGKFDSFHERVFRAYFTDLKDIGDKTVLLDLAQEDGLDPTDLEKALVEDRYGRRVEESTHTAAQLGVSAIPTFIINESIRIVGALDTATFRKRLQAVQK